MSIKDVKQLGARIANGSKRTPLDATAIRELAELLTETGLTEIEIEQGGQPFTNSGRATEVFVYRNGAWVNSSWHLDSGK